MTPLQSLLQKRRRALRQRVVSIASRERTRRFLSLGFFAGIIVLAIGYVVIVNAVSTQGLHISQLHKQAADLKETHTQMQLTIADLQSLDKLENQLPANTYEKVASVEYIRSATPAVASR